MKIGVLELVSQDTELFENFSAEERAIHNLLIIKEIGQEAQWFGPFGACLVKVYGMRRALDGGVEFGIGSEKPPILGWVKAEEFFNEWPS